MYEKVEKVIAGLENAVSEMTDIKLMTAELISSEVEDE